MHATEDKQGDHRVAFNISREAYRKVRLVAADRMIPAAHLMATLIEDYAKSVSASIEKEGK